MGIWSEYKQRAGDKPQIGSHLILNFLCNEAATCYPIFPESGNGDQTPASSVLEYVLVLV